MQNHLIIGYGEIGQAIEELLEGQVKIYTHDLNGIHNMQQCAKYDCIHICLPWCINFDSIVKKYLNKVWYKYCIIHSTISPKCKIIFNNKKIAYSPVRGKHPLLAKGIKTFPKAIASIDNVTLEYVKELYNQIGIKYFRMCVKGAIYAKLLDTTYYGVCIAFADYVKKICDKENIDYEYVYKQFNMQYNDGYYNLKLPNVIRPVLTPPDEKIGGHCVVENSILLEELYDSPILDIIQNLKLTHKNEI